MRRSHAHAATFHGEGRSTLLLAHGLGGTQDQWTPLVRLLQDRYRIVTFSLAGSAGADPSLFSPLRHASLLGFADDLAMLCADLDLRGAVYVGHSLSAMAGALASVADPGLFSRLVLLNGSARYVDDPETGYVGGFGREQVDELLGAIASDFAGWSAGFAQYVVANPGNPGFASEFAGTLRQYPPDVALAAFRAAFTSDVRAWMPRVPVPTLVLSSEADPAVPMEAALWLSGAIPGARFGRLSCTGHFPHALDPGGLRTALEPFLP